MKHLLILLFCLWALHPIKADRVATIGQTTKIINKSTSCDAKNWEPNQLNACACCLTKHSNSSPASSDAIVGACLTGKYCTTQLLNQLAPGQTIAEDIINVVLWSTVDTPAISLNPDYLDKSGKLKIEISTA